MNFVNILILCCGQTFETLFYVLALSHILRLFSKNFCLINVRKFLFIVVIASIFSIIARLSVIYYPTYMWLRSCAYILLLSVSVAILYKISFLKSFICTLACSTLSALVEVVMIIIFKLMSFNVTDMIDRIDISTIITFFISVITYLITILIAGTFQKHKLQFELDNNKLNCIFPQILTFAICMFFTMFLMVLDNFKYSVYFIIINAIQLLSLTFICSISSKEMLKHEDTKQILSNTLSYNETLKKVNEGVRGFKHDMSNIVQAILGYAAMNDIDGIKKYCNNLVVGFNDINVLSILSPEVINEPAIYGIVANKILLARQKNMTLTLDVCTDVKSINFPKYELSRILGILLDNAIEAGEKTEEKKLILNIHHDYANKADIISIGNSVASTNIDIAKIFERDYSTKAKPSGFGLYEVRNFIDKNPQAVICTDIDTENKIFSQTIIIDC